MGLKFERTNDLDKLFENFAVDPEKKVQSNKDVEKFLKPEDKEKKEDKKK